MKNKKLSTSMTDSRFGGWGWSMIFYTMILYFFYAALTTDGMNLIPGAFAQAKGWDSNVLLSYATPAGILGLIGGFIFGRLVIKTKPRNMSGVTLIITGILYAVFGMAPSVTMYVVLLMLICFFASGFGTAACPAFIANWFPRKKGIALGWATMGAPLSSAAFVGGFSVMLEKLGVQKSFLFVGIAVVIIGIITFFWAKNEPEEVGCLPDNMAVDKNVKAEEPAAGDAYSLKNILKNKVTWLIIFGYGMLWMVLVGIISQLVPRMMSVGYSQPEAMRFMVITSLIAIPGSYIWGWLDSKFGTKIISVVFAVSYIVALVLMITAFNPVCVWIGCIFAGLGIGGLLNLLASMIISAFGREGFMPANSVIYPLASVIQKIAFVLVGSLLAISGGSYTLPYIVFIVIDIIGAVIIMFIPYKKEQ
ncbi:MAG: MFS transporter [Clostridiales bacterium]|nr:MFS transporter [Clostridiales bacterium]MDY3746252.1 MFS transporter [Lachnospiraceae bacterium]